MLQARQGVEVNHESGATKEKRVQYSFLLVGTNGLGPSTSRLCCKPVKEEKSITKAGIDLPLMLQAHQGR